MRRASLILSIVVVLLVASACGSSSTVDSDAGSTAPSNLAAMLDGRTFDSTSVTVSGAARPLAKPIMITFEGDVLRASPGCNLSGGHFTLDGDRLEMGDMDSTVMACADAALMDQDDWFGSLFDAPVALALDGDQLTLTSGDTVIVLLDHQNVDPDRPLVGTTWVLESINDGPTASSVPSGVRAMMRLPDTSTVTWGACNGLRATVLSIEPTTFVLGEVVSTTMACSDEKNQVEKAMNQVLEGTVTYAIDGPVLHVVKGDRRLDFRAT